MTTIIRCDRCDAVHREGKHLIPYLVHIEGQWLEVKSWRPRDAVETAFVLLDKGNSGHPYGVGTRMLCSVVDLEETRTHWRLDVVECDGVRGVDITEVVA